MLKIKLSAQEVRQALIADGAKPFAVDTFLAYSKKIPRVWLWFEKFSLEAWNAGKRKYGAQSIAHRVRWYVEIENGAGDFKINNNWIAYYARIFLLQYPEAKEVEFFEVRELKKLGENEDGTDRRYERDTNAANEIVLPDIQPRHEAGAGLDAQNKQQGLFSRGN